MIFEDAIDEVKAAETPEVLPVVLAQVTSVSDGKAYVQFYGESTPSTKTYPYIDGYNPAANDVVALLAQGNTFIIIGKVSTAAVSDYYAKRSELNSEIAALASVYLTQSGAASTYLTITNAASTYLTITNAANTYLSQTDAASTYRGINAYFDRLGSGAYNIVISGQNANVNGNLNFGNSSYPFRSVTSTYIDTDHIRTPSGANALDISSGLVTPTINNGTSLGSSSKKFANIYANNIYGTVADSSDKRLKKSIKTLGRKWLDFFYKLRPTSFKYKNGESGRTHTGFIAQEVEQAANDAGISTKDIAAVVVDKDGTYGIRYSELISVLTLAIQDLNKRVEALEGRDKK